MREARGQKRHTKNGFLGSRQKDALGSGATRAKEGNEPWGNDPYNIERKGCRIVFQNVNGISRQEHFTKAHEIGEAALYLGANIVGLCEKR